jgi:hypothetical protein
MKPIPISDGTFTILLYIWLEKISLLISRLTRHQSIKENHIYGKFSKFHIKL